MRSGAPRGSESEQLRLREFSWGEACQPQTERKRREWMRVSHHRGALFDSAEAACE